MQQSAIDPMKKKAILFDALNSEQFELILFPTEQCNFRCVYCYEDFEKGRMSPETIYAIKTLISRRVRALKLFHISWFGGEPMIAYDIVTDLMRHSFNNCAATGARFSAAATTNGYNLTKSRFVELDRLNMQTYQISLDGVQDHHNTTRVRIDGAGTFERIWSNLLGFDELHRQGEIINGTILLRLHVTPANTTSIMDLARRISDELDPGGFMIHVKNVGHYGGKSDTDRAIINSWQPDYKRVEGEIYSLLSNFDRGFTDPVYVCYACKANSLSIRSDGSINKCTVALNSESNRVGHINPDGTLHIENSKLQRWLKPLETMEVAALGCPVSHLPPIDS